MDIETDKLCHKMIAIGKQTPVAIPELPDERPPGPLTVYIKEKKKKKPFKFSLNLGGVSLRFPAEREKKLKIFISEPSSDDPSQEKKRKIQSIPIPANCDEMLVVFVKPLSNKWTGYRVIPLNLSSKRIPAKTVLLANFSKRNLVITPEQSGRGRVLKAGGKILYEFPTHTKRTRILYSDARTPEKILCAVNCEAMDDRRTIIVSYGLGTPENGIDIATRSLELPIKPLKLATEPASHSQ